MTALKLCTYILVLLMMYVASADKLKYAAQTKPTIGATKLSYILDFYPVQTQLSFWMHVSMIFRDDRTESEPINKWYLLSNLARNVCKGKILTFQIVDLLTRIRKQLGSDIVAATIRIKVKYHSPSTTKSYISDFVNINAAAVETPRLGTAKQVILPKRDQYTATKRRSTPQRVVSDPPLRPQRLPMPQRQQRPQIPVIPQRQIPQEVTRSAGRRPNYSLRGFHAVPAPTNTVNTAVPITTLHNATNDSGIYSVDDIEREWKSSHIDTDSKVMVSSTTLIPTRAHNTRDIYTTRFTHTQQPNLSKPETQNISSPVSFSTSESSLVTMQNVTASYSSTDKENVTSDKSEDPLLLPKIENMNVLDPPVNINNNTASPTNTEMVISESSENPLLEHLELTTSKPVDSPIENVLETPVNVDININNVIHDAASSTNKENVTSERNDSTLLPELRSPEPVHINGLETHVIVNINNDTYNYSIKHDNASHKTNTTTNKHHGIPIFMRHSICVLSFAVFVMLVVCILIVYAFRDNIRAKLYSQSSKQRVGRHMAMQVNDAFVTNVDNAFIHTSISYEDRQIKQDWIRGTL